MRAFISLWLTCGMLLASAGCRQHAHQYADNGGKALHTVAGELPVVSRTRLDLDLQKFPGLDILNIAAPSVPYRSLTELECQCLAVRASSLGNLLEKEESLVASKKKGHHARADLKQAMVTTSAQVARNKDAGSALKLYYRLAEAEAKWDLLDTSLTRVKEATSQLEKLKEKGLRVPPEFEEFQRQEMDLSADMVRLNAGIAQLNRLLANALDLPNIPERERIWPLADWSVPSQPVDVASAVSVGLANRPELVLLRRVQQDSSLGGLDAARKLLSAASPVMGMSGVCCLAKLKAVLCAGEKSVREDQLASYLPQQERDIAAEIRQAAHDVGRQIQLVALARQRTRTAESKFKEQQDKRAKGSAALVEVTSAHISLLKTRAELVKEAVAWRIARVRLKQVQGLLVMECGNGSQGPADQPDCATESLTSDRAGRSPSPNFLPSDLSGKEHY